MLSFHLVHVRSMAYGNGQASLIAVHADDVDLLVVVAGCCGIEVVGWLFLGILLVVDEVQAK